MATLDQLESALVKADAAGNADDARALAGAIRQMRAQTPQGFQNSVGRIPKPGVVDPTEGMTFGQQVGAGFGRSFVETGRGIGQLFGAVDQDSVDRSRQADAPLLDSAGGFTGNLAGQVAQVSMPVGGAAKALSFAGKAAPYVGAAIRGGAFTGSQTVGDGESRLGNTGEGAAYGAGGQVLSAGGGALARGAISRLDDVGKALAGKAQQYGIPLGTAQLSQNPMVRTVADQLGRLPFSGARKAAEVRQGALNQAVAKTLGEKANRLTPDVVSSAANRIGQQFEQISARNALPASPQLMSNLGRVRAEADRLAGTDTAGKVNQWIGELLGKADQSGKIPGAAYKSFDSRLGKELMGGGESAHYLGMIREAARSAMDKAISPRDKAAWDLARKQWAALKTIEPLAAKSATGDISAQSLMGRVTADKAGKVRMARGNAGDLGDLARIGQRFMKAAPDSGSADRALVNLGVGGALYGAQDRGYIDPQTAIMAGGLLGLNRYGLRALNSPAIANGESRALNGLARLVKPAPKLLPALAPGMTTRNENR